MDSTGIVGVLSRARGHGGFALGSDWALRRAPSHAAGVWAAKDGADGARRVRRRRRVVRLWDPDAPAGGASELARHDGRVGGGGGAPMGHGRLSAWRAHLARIDHRAAGTAGAPRGRPAGHALLGFHFTADDSRRPAHRQSRGRTEGPFPRELDRPSPAKREAAPGRSACAPCCSCAKTTRFLRSRLGTWAPARSNAFARSAAPSPFHARGRRTTG